MTETSQNCLCLTVTKEGHDRKKRIVDKIFMERKETKLIMWFYVSVLPLMKAFVILFEMKEPLIQILHEKQVKLFKDFLSCYVKPQVINTATSASKLKSLDILSTKNLLKQAEMFMGIKAQKVVQDEKDYCVCTFLEKVEKAYTECGKTLQQKLPINNTLLKSLAALHPHARGHSLSLSCLQKLPNFVTNVLTEEEEETYNLEARRFQTDNSLPEYKEDDRVDHFWGSESVQKAYPTLSKMAVALMTCFHGPQVESSFSVMNEIIDSKSGRIKVETFNAIQTTRYALNVKGGHKSFLKQDFLHMPVDRQLVKNMKQSHMLYKEELEKAQKEKELLKQKFDIEKKMQLGKGKQKN